MGIARINSKPQFHFPSSTQLIATLSHKNTSCDLRFTQTGQNTS